MNTFSLKPSSTSLIYNLSQMKGHLINLKSNGLKSIMNVNVLLEIHALASIVTGFDKILKNPCLRKSPCSLLFESKLKSISLISFNFNSLSAI